MVAVDDAVVEVVVVLVADADAIHGIALTGARNKTAKTHVSYNQYFW